MYQRRMTYLFGAATATFALHIVEQRIFGFSEALGTVQNAYATYETWFRTAEGAAVTTIVGTGFLVLLFMFLMFLGDKWRVIPAIFFGLLFLTEIHHFLGAVNAKHYYPGAVTGLILTGLGITIVKESITYLVSKSYGQETS
jgi:hypothetical protein